MFVPLPGRAAVQQVVDQLVLAQEAAEHRPRAEAVVEAAGLGQRGPQRAHDLAVDPVGAVYRAGEAGLLVGVVLGQPHRCHHHTENLDCPSPPEGPHQAVEHGHHLLGLRTGDQHGLRGRPIPSVTQQSTDGTYGRVGCAGFAGGGGLGQSPRPLRCAVVVLTAGLVVAFGLGVGAVLGEQRTVGGADLVSDLPQRRGQALLAVFDLRDHARAAAQCRRQLGLRHLGGLARVGQVRTQAAAHLR